ncbi:heavy metal translocating P-type ATPase [Paenibacillus agricola]|uniref:Cd(2+)-exporting ATPase n=1 Tax=Paenibacillus agricola TaxID=2716264 RepID=A0ABX0JEK4_9BACL|nr:heavy metal translocating P-type ATPase [Paenibacillus agricola]NHN33661.1 cadmium-translocating P-type ATPase [Paenibacillus agricola]
MKENERTASGSTNVPKELPVFKKSLDFTVSSRAVPQIVDSCCSSEPRDQAPCCNDDGCSSTPSKGAGDGVDRQVTDGIRKTYHVHGMDCSSCALTIENHLKAQPFVRSVNVNFSSATMKIEHDNDASHIIREVSKLGYKASLISKRRGQAEAAPLGRATSLPYLSGALLAFGYLGSLAGVSAGLTTLLYAASMVIVGYKPAKSAFYAAKSKSLDMNVLMTVAALGAVSIGEWLEGATVVWLFAIGNMLQTRSIDKTRNTIQSLMDLAPTEAWLQTANGLILTPVEDISVGERIVVKPGEKIPLDGEVSEGLSMVNQAPITGESVPVDKEPGSTVYAGSLNENGSLEIRVTKLPEDSAVARIIHMVEEAQDKKAPTQTFVDQFARIYTPVVFILALAVMVLPPLFSIGSWSEWFYKGLELLVVACPCALVISTPVAIISAIGNAARQGVLIKGGSSLEIAGKINAIAFDKTGTLTEGKPKVSSVIGFGVPEEEVIAIGRTIEEYSTHPIARAIVQYALDKQISSRTGGGYQAIAGKGAQATTNGKTYFAGNAKLFQGMQVSLAPIEKALLELQNKGNTLVIVGTAESLLGVIAVADTIRPISSQMIKKLKGLGIRQSVMLTGDNEGTAAKISEQAGVDRYFAELLPEHKVEAVHKMQQEGYKIAMVGDGINDAPALAAADLGIAMGGAGTDTAMETADIVLMADNLERLPYTIQLSRKALVVIKQNIWFSLTVKAIALLLIFPGWLTLWIAVLSDTGAAIIVILNSMRLLRMK